MAPHDERYWTLIQSFHAMEHCPNLHKNPGPHEWIEAMRVWLHERGSDPFMDEGVQWACIFLLNVWSTGGTDRPWPVFELFRAMSAWDIPHQRAFLVWVMSPFRP